MYIIYVYLLQENICHCSFITIVRAKSYIFNGYKETEK